MRQYLDLVQRILDEGGKRGDRTGVGTLTIFGPQMEFDLRQGFPLVTTKKVNFDSVVHELLWFLRGETNIQSLVREGVNIWNEWAFQGYLEDTGLDKKFVRYSTEWKQELKVFAEKVKTDDEFASRYGELGPIYGKQWRRWETKDGKVIDQIQEALNLIRTDPSSRRILVSGWNVGEILPLIWDHNRAPPPCHSLFQFHVMGDELSCKLYQRTSDMFLGVPFNIASYALLTHMVAQACGLNPKQFIHTSGDAHLYLNHVEKARKQLERSPRKLPRLELSPEVTDLFSFKREDIKIVDYDPHPPIYAQVAV